MYRTALFTTAFRNVGLSGDFGGTYFLTRLAGEGEARELYFTGDVISAEEALHHRIVNRVVPHNELESETMALAVRIADGPAGAYARMKRNFVIAAKGDLALSLQEEALNMTLSGLSTEAREAARICREAQTELPSCHYRSVERGHADAPPVRRS